MKILGRIFIKITSCWSKVVLKNPLTVYKNLLQIAKTIEKVNKDKVALNKAIFSLKNRCVYRIVYGIIKNKENL
jgi:hypothetical protein